MNQLSPIESLFERAPGRPVRLPRKLARVYGEFRLPARGSREYVIANFASTLDGVVALGGPAQNAGGGAITGFNPHDRFLMGLLRALADVVVVGAGTLRSVPHHLWTAPYIFPGLAPSFAELRRNRGSTKFPVNVIVTGEGNLDVSLPVFHTPEVPALVVTRSQNIPRLRKAGLPKTVPVVGVRTQGPLRAASVLKAVGSAGPPGVVLVEGGPHLMGSFFQERCLDELFLTVAPQVAGRDDAVDRLGLVMGRTFAPEHPLWGSLAGVRRADSLLFLRLAFERGGRG